MNDDQRAEGELVAHVLDHPCPDCKAPPGIECGQTRGWSTVAGTPRLGQQCRPRITAGNNIHAALTAARARRLGPSRSDACPPWCQEHVEFDGTPVHGVLVRTLRTSALGDLDVLVLARRDEPDSAFAIIVHSGDQVIGLPLEEAVISMPHLLAGVIDTQRQASSTRRPRGGS